MTAAVHSGDVAVVLTAPPLRDRLRVEHARVPEWLDVSVPTARSRWNAESPLDLDELYRIATHLGVSIADLIPAGSNRAAA